MEPLRLRMLVTVEDTDRQAAALRVGVPHAEGLAVRVAVAHADRERLPLEHALADALMLALRLSEGVCEEDTLADTETEADAKGDSEDDPVAEGEEVALGEGLALRLRVGEPLRLGVADDKAERVMVLFADRERGGAEALGDTTVVRVSVAKEGVELVEGQGLGDDCALIEMDRVGDTVLLCEVEDASDAEEVRVVEAL